MKDKLSSLLLNEGIEVTKQYYKDKYHEALFWAFLIGLVIGSVGAII